jgi:hypothetical protein
MKYVKIWLLGSIALAGLSFLAWMLTAHPSDASSNGGGPTTTCESIRNTALALVPQNATWTERSTPAYQQKWMTMNNLVIDNGNCFTPEIVAAAKAALQNYLGH